MDDGIGNAIQVLYALEHCQRAGKSAGIFLGSKISSGFVAYIKRCYTQSVVDVLKDVSTVHLVHSWLYDGPVECQYRYYHYIHADERSTKVKSETEQYLSVVSSAMEVDSTSPPRLGGLVGQKTARVVSSVKRCKYLLYPGCAPACPSKRWPHFNALVDLLGPANCVVAGSKADWDFDCSFYYPSWITRLVPPFLLKRKGVFLRLQRLNLLRSHAHLRPFPAATTVFTDLSWEELVALIESGLTFIGNDGALSHLAGACGAKGVILFGPSSVSKNRTYNRDIRPFSLNLSCSPCQFRVNGVDEMSKSFISCPRQVACLREIRPEQVAEQIAREMDFSRMDLP